MNQSAMVRGPTGSSLSRRCHYCFGQSPGLSASSLRFTTLRLLSLRTAWASTCAAQQCANIKTAFIYGRLHAALGTELMFDASTTSAVYARLAPSRWPNGRARIMRRVPVSFTGIYLLFIELSAAFRSNILLPTGSIVIHRSP